jgi:DNA-binding LacI/PurR family transcriptional regulator
MPAGRQHTPRATLRDVAERAGVATSTASIVFSGRKPVAEATADRVRAAAAELGYLGPDPLAASLRQGRSGIVGAFVEGRLPYAFHDPYAALVLQGLSQVLGDLELGLLLIPDTGDVRARPVQQPLDAVVFVLCSEERNPLVDSLESRGIPMVGTGAPLGPTVRQLRIDERGAQRAAAQHLVDLGHDPSRLAHLLLPLQPHGPTTRIDARDIAAATYPDSRDRALGFCDVAGADRLMAQAAEPTVALGHAAAALLLDGDVRPTGIVAQSDLLAVGAMRAAAERGLRVPDDLSVTGFDGVDLPGLPHQLTTVDQRAHAKGLAVGAMVRDLLDGKRVRDRTHRVELVVGSSTAPPRRLSVGR